MSYRFYLLRIIYTSLPIQSIFVPTVVPLHATHFCSYFSQWESLHRALTDAGHTIELIDPLPGLPDMVFAANGATVVDGKVLAVQFRDPERADEAPAYRAWFESKGFDVYDSKHTNEGEGDILLAGDVLLAGTGFRTVHAAHLQTQEVFGRPVVSLQLVDPAYYHLDTALFVLDESDDSHKGNIAYYPGAFSPGSREVLARLYPDAVVGYLGMERDEITHEPHDYYAKLPPLGGRRALVVDPMLATGGSGSAAVRYVKESSMY